VHLNRSMKNDNLSFKLISLVIIAGVILAIANPMHATNGSQPVPATLADGAR
jgi:hypothetical protein